jgi:hypothetical protein
MRELLAISFYPFSLKSHGKSWQAQIQMGTKTNEKILKTRMIWYFFFNSEPDHSLFLYKK